MQKPKQSLLTKLLSMLIGVVMMAAMITVFIPLPSANAAAATTVLVSATFNDAGLTACTDNILVTFTEPVCSDADCTTGLGISNFGFTNGNAAGMASISSVTHTAGNNWALLIMNTTSVAGDTADTLRIKEVFTPSGMVKEDSALTVALTADTTAPTISVGGKRFKEAADDLLLQFSEPVQDEQCTNTALASTDFTYADTGADTMVSISTATSTANRDWVYLTGNANHAAATDAAETLAPTDNKIYDMVGNEWTEAATAISTFTSDTAIPTISSAYGRKNDNGVGGNDLVFVNFSEPVFAASTNSGNLVAADFAHSTAAVSTFTHTAGDTFGLMDLDANQSVMGTVDSEAGDDDVFDVFGNALTAATAAVTITDNTFPVLRGVWVNQFIDHGSTAGLASANFAVPVGANTAVTNAIVTTEVTIAYPQEGSKMYYLTDATALAADEGFMSYDTNVDLYDTTNDLYEFTQVKFDAYYQDDSAATALTDNADIEFVLNDTADFITPSRFPITTDLTEKTWTTVTINLTGTASGTALASQTANPQFWGIRVNATTNIATSDDLYIDNIRFSREASSKSNQIILEYSETIDLTGDPSVGTNAASTATVGNITTDKTLAGMGAFAAGTFTAKTLTNNIAKSADGTMYTITLANGSGGILTSASPVTVSGLFTPTANVTDAAGQAIATGSTHTPETVIDTLDLTTAATAPTDFVPTLVTGGQVRFGWTAPSQTAATFSHYAIVYGTTAGVTVANSLWDESNDALLSTATTNSTTVTGLTDGTVYYFNIAAVDTKGIPTTLVTEKSALPSAASGSKAETVAPAVPTGLKAVINDAGKVVLTWTDPTDADLSYVQIAKSIGKDAVPASILASVNAGLKTYTDTAVNIGDVANYMIKSVDKNSNSSAYSSVVSVTVKIGETSSTTATGTSATTETLTVNLSAQNTSGQSGTATITEVGGKAKVVLALTGNPQGVSQPAHIHMGSCAVPGDVKYTLTSVLNGASETTLDVSLAALKAGLPLIVNVHKSAAESATYYSCGDILLAAAGTETGVEDDTEDTVEEDDVDMEVTTEIKLTDIATHWAKTEIQAMVEAGVIKGYKDGSFKPNNNLNRAESAILLCRVLGIDETEAAVADPFSDVKKDSWYGGCVAELKTAMIVKGNPDKTYKPVSNINRAEFITLVMRAYAEMLDEDEKADLDAMLNATTPKASFTDVKTTDWYANTAYAAMQMEFVKGRTCGANKCFDGGTSITRAEATTVLFRVFGEML